MAALQRLAQSQQPDVEYAALIDLFLQGESRSKFPKWLSVRLG
jgi:hypothetical protein